MITDSGEYTQVLPNARSGPSSKLNHVTVHVCGILSEPSFRPLIRWIFDKKFEDLKNFMREGHLRQVFPLITQQYEYLDCDGRSSGIPG